MRLIDADKLPLDKIDDANYGSNYIRIAPTVDAIPIPKGATNGDMIKAMFPNISINEKEFTDLVMVYKLDHHRKAFSEDWWNAPYKEG